MVLYLQPIFNDEDYAEYRGGLGKESCPSHELVSYSLITVLLDGEKAYFPFFFFFFSRTACLPVYPPLDGQSKSIARTYTKVFNKLCWSI